MPVMVVIKRRSQPGCKDNSRSDDGCASLAARTCWAIPPVIRRVHRASPDVVDADAGGFEVVEVQIDLTPRGIEGNIDRLIVKDILRDDGSGDRRHAKEIDSGRA